MGKEKVFHPHTRYSLVEAVFPPENYVVDCAVGTTYSMDFESLTAILLGFLAFEAEPEKHTLERDAGLYRPSATNMLYSLRAISRFAPMIRVYVNHGFIHPRHHNPLFPLYDRIVRQVSFVNNIPPAHFHPKVWVIKYTSTKDLTPSGLPAALYRLLVLSRNLTHDHFLDLAAVMDATVDRSNPTGQQVAEFVSHLTRLPQEKEKVPDRIMRLIEELPRVMFQPPEGSDKINFLWNSPGIGTLLKRIPRSGQALVLSPFLDDKFVNRLIPLNPLTLISTSEALEKLSEEIFTRLCAGGKNRIYTIDNDIVDDENNPLEASDRAFGLHGKMFLFEDREKSETLLGSANATMRGFERNCEAMVALSPGISIAKFRANFLLNDKKELHSYIREYNERDYHAANRKEVEEQTKREQVMEAARKALCQVDLKQCYDRSARLLILRASKKDQSVIPDEVTASVCPLCIVEKYANRFPRLAPVFSVEGLVFPDCQTQELTEFVHCRIESADGSRRIEFIEKTQTDFADLMDTRDQNVRRNILSNKNDFLRLILFGSIRNSEQRTGEHNQGGEGRASGLSNVLGDIVTIEDVMQACTEDPYRIEEVNQWLRDLHTEDVDQTFIQFWNSFTAAISETGTRSRTCR